MPKITFVDPSGHERAVEASSEVSLMLAAVQHGVPGIVGECGGNNSCATCHVWVRDEFVGRVGAPGDLEEDLLDLAVEERRSGSRLSCQILATEALDGVVVDVPPEHC